MALAFYRDPRDPKVYSEASLNDPGIRALCRKVKTEVRKETSSKSHSAALVTARLKDGREVSHDAEFFPGMLQQPLSRAELQEKFKVLTASLPEGASQLFNRLVKVETIDDLRQVWST